MEIESEIVLGKICVRLESASLPSSLGAYRSRVAHPDWPGDLILGALAKH
jgi:hypothetical protein